MMSASEKTYPVKVSIVLPTFNQANFLASAIETILKQTYDNFELIIVNDGSTDDTAKMLASIKHPKLHVITQQNQGLPSALNAGFAVARGEYWTWTSTDNTVAPTWLEELVKALDSSAPDVGYAFSHYAAVDESGKILFVNRELHFDIPNLLFRHRGNASFLYRSELAKKVGAYDVTLSHAEDLDMWIRMAEQTRAVLVETVLYYYRVHSNSMTAQRAKVQAATKGVVTKFLAKTGGIFDIDALFPSIKLSADPALERWKARVWLVTLGVNAFYYCPGHALLDQLAKALSEKYERNLVGNMVHLFAKEGRWKEAAQAITLCRQADNDSSLAKLADIVARQAQDELKDIPFIIIQENFLAADCKGPWTQQQLLGNLASNKPAPTEKPISIESIAIDLVNQLEDQQDHPEVWKMISSLQSQKEILNKLHLYFAELAKIPQETLALALINTLEAVCLAYNNNASGAIQKLQQLTQQHPALLVARGALKHLQEDNALSTPQTSTTTKSSNPLDATLQAMTDFIASQSKINSTLMQRLQSIEFFSAVNARNLNNKLHDLEQTLHLVARRQSRAQQQRIRCVFLVHFLQAWNTIAPVYEAMKASDDFEPIVISTARKYNQITRVIFGEDLVHKFLESEGVPHLRFDTSVFDNNSLDILKTLAPDIIFRQSPWADLPPIFNAEDINFTRLCYIPYSFSAVKRVDKKESADSTSSSSHTDLYYHRICWRIFCETEMHRTMYLNNSRHAANVVITGYPKFDHLIAAKKQPPLWPITNKNSSKRRFRVIWAPHHSVTADVLGFGTFVETHKEMLEWAQQSQDDYEFVLKPHPALVSEVVHELKAFSQEYMDNFFAAWKALPNTAIDEGGNYGPLFVGSDVMLTDGVGFLSEYQLFEKPVIFIDSGRHFGFNQVGDIMMESVNAMKTIFEARAFCAQLKEGTPDPKRALQQKVLARIMPYPGKSAQNILTAIREGLLAEGVNIPTFKHHLSNTRLNALDVEEVKTNFMPLTDEL